MLPRLVNLLFLATSLLIPIRWGLRIHLPPVMLIGESANFKRNRGTSACIRKRDAHLWEMVADQVIDAPSEWMPLGAFLNIEEFHRAKYDNGGREKNLTAGASGVLKSTTAFETTSLCRSQIAEGEMPFSFKSPKPAQ